MGIKVAHFSFGDGYGALGAAYELHRSLLKRGVDSSFFVRRKTKNDDSIIELGYCGSVEERLLRTINTLYFTNNKINEGNTIVNFDCLGLQWDEKLEEQLNGYNLFHIHWVAGFLNIDNIYQLSRLGKPIVWTMHDFHPFTGGCHCPESCKKYESDCADCFMLKYNSSDITKSILLEKQHKYSTDICIVTASEWLKDIVHHSKIFANNMCEVIPIGIDTECFVPKNKGDMKNKIGLSENTKVILAGAQALRQNIKGYVHLKQILQTVKSDAYCKELIQKRQLVLLTFGNTDGLEIQEEGIPIINAGFVDDREKLCEIYNAADVFVFPSIQDTFGMTAVEAMSCGIPAVAFDLSAMKEVIIPGVNGYKAKAGDYHSMGSAIIHILRDNPISADICRKRIVDDYSLKCETEKMLRLYEKAAGRELSIAERKNFGENSSKLENFIHKCAFEILTGTVPDQCVGTAAQEILLTYNPKFMSPEQKIKQLIKDQKINDKMVLYIYGAGRYGKEILEVLEKEKINIGGVWDLDERKKGKIIGKYNIDKPVRKEKFEGNGIIVAGMDYLNMINCLSNLGYLYGQDFY